jgi:hypothetical protein
VAYGCSIGGIATLVGTLLIFLCQDFEIIYPNARNFFWSVADLRATIKFNNVCRNFSCSLYYVSSTKDFEVLDKSF